MPLNIPSERGDAHDVDISDGHNKVLIVRNGEDATGALASFSGSNYQSHP